MGGDQVIGTLISGISALIRSYYEDTFEDTVIRELTTSQEEGTRYQRIQHLDLEVPVLELQEINVCCLNFTIYYNNPMD